MYDFTLIPLIMTAAVMGAFCIALIWPELRKRRPRAVPPQIHTSGATNRVAEVFPDEGR
jgi:hypothetical protein